MSPMKPPNRRDFLKLLFLGSLSLLIPACTSQETIVQIASDYVKRHEYEKAKEVIRKINYEENRNMIWSEMTIDILTYQNDFVWARSELYNIPSSSGYYINTITVMSRFEASRGNVENAISIAALVQEVEERDILLNATGHVFVNSQNMDGALQAFSSISGDELRYGGIEELLDASLRQEEYLAAVDMAAYIDSDPRRDANIEHIVMNMLDKRLYQECIPVLSSLSTEDRRDHFLDILVERLLQQGDYTAAVSAASSISDTRRDRSISRIISSMLISKMYEQANTMIASLSLSRDRDHYLDQLARQAVIDGHYEIALYSVSQISGTVLKDQGLKGIADSMINKQMYRESIDVIAAMSRVEDRDLELAAVVEGYIFIRDLAEAEKTAYMITDETLMRLELSRIK